MARKHGFTLIELLIVIAIIGILAAVLIPNLLRAREAAQMRAVEAHAKNVYTASVAYLAEEPTRTEVLGDCTHGINIGGYAVANPKNTRMASCTVADSDADGSPEVVAVLTSGTEIRFP